MLIVLIGCKSREEDFLAVDPVEVVPDIVYKADNSIMTPEERLELQAQLNNGNPIPPAGGRIPNNP
ncbi:hypothetical protein [uncultured Chryseobacterium sp.]|uniref:hypothetical protein n=1 Tax=uncultured Chryseobacterium sp. TaxID=259322 RepID=UPI002633E350|nr:hypothetical protein [uncultured Chryseobacterium sp.]